jgi:predicted porin
MKKLFLMLTTLSLAGAASAQSSVNLFGLLDVGVSGYSSQSQTPLGVTVTKTQTALTQGNSLQSRLGFRGTEDLGGGLGANYWLEGTLITNNGTGVAAGGGIAFNRRSTVGLSGVFGELRLGRDYTPSYLSDNIFDPFNNNGVGASLIAVASGLSASYGVPNSGFQANPNYVTAPNSIGYLTPPSLGGFYGQLMYALNGATSIDPGGLTAPGAAAIVANPALAAVGNNARVGRYIGGRIGYTKGPLDVALGVASSTVASNYYVGSTTNLDIWNLGASYDFDVVKLFAEYSNNKQNTNLAVNAFNPFGATKPGANGGLLGLTVPIGVGLVKFSYSAVDYNNVPVNLYPSQPKADQFAAGYVYNLSKRTALYANAAYVSNKGGASLAVNGAPLYYVSTVPGGIGNAVPNKSMGYNIGMRHAF